MSGGTHVQAQANPLGLSLSSDENAGGLEVAGHLEK